MRYLAAFLSAFVFFEICPAAIACSPPPDGWVGSTVASPSPGKKTPKGATQLKVALPEDSYAREGRITVPVLEVVDGKFSGVSIRLNISNVDHCNTYLSMSFVGVSYITVLPMKFSDGEAVRDKKGSAEFGALFYRDFDIDFLLENPVPEFAEYSEYQNFSFYDSDRMQCVFDGQSTAEAWRRCVEPGEYVSLDCRDNKSGALICEESDWPPDRPPELRRGYSFWNKYGVSLLLVLLTLSALLGVGYYLRKGQVEE